MGYKEVMLGSVDLYSSPDYSFGGSARGWLAKIPSAFKSMLFLNSKGVLVENSTEIRIAKTDRSLSRRNMRQFLHMDGQRFICLIRRQIGILANHTSIWF
jgi:hypothetical protein